MSRMSNKEKSLRARYFEGARKVVESFGAVPLRVYVPETEGYSPSADYELMTDFGRLELHVHDNWTATSFDRPRLAAGSLGCNPHSGKWNHHCFGLDARDATQRYVDEHLDLLRHELERVGATAWKTRPVPISFDMVDSGDVEALRDREALGEEFLIVGFDKMAAAEEISSQVTDSNGDSPEELVQSSFSSLMRQGDLEAYLTLQRWRAHLAETNEAGPSPTP